MLPPNQAECLLSIEFPGEWILILAAGARVANSYDRRSTKPGINVPPPTHTMLASRIGRASTSTEETESMTIWESGVRGVVGGFESVVVVVDDEVVPLVVLVEVEEEPFAFVNCGEESKRW